jgi:hypothetical protein
MLTVQLENWNKNLNCWTLASHWGDPDSVPDYFKWDLWWTKWHWSRFSPESFGFLPLIIIPPLLHTHPSPPHEGCDIPDQAAHHHTLSPKLGAASPTRHLFGLEIKVVCMRFSRWWSCRQYMRFQVLTATSMNTTVFWDVAPCSLVEMDRRFRGAHCLHHQGIPNFYKTTRRNIPEDSHLLGGSIALLHVDTHLQVHTALQPRRPPST